MLQLWQCAPLLTQNRLWQLLAWLGEEALLRSALVAAAAVSDSVPFCQALVNHDPFQLQSHEFSGWHACAALLTAGWAGSKRSSALDAAGLKLPDSLKAPSPSSAAVACTELIGALGPVKDFTVALSALSLSAEYSPADLATVSLRARLPWAQGGPKHWQRHLRYATLETLCHCSNTRFTCFRPLGAGRLVVFCDAQTNQAWLGLGLAIVLYLWFGLDKGLMLFFLEGKQRGLLAKFLLLCLSGRQDAGRRRAEAVRLICRLICLYLTPEVSILARHLRLLQSFKSRLRCKLPSTYITLGDSILTLLLLFLMNLLVAATLLQTLQSPTLEIASGDRGACWFNSPDQHMKEEYLEYSVEISSQKLLNLS